MFSDDSDVDHFAYTAIDAVDWSGQHTYRLVLDFADMSRMGAWMDGDSSGMTYSGNTGVVEFDLTDTKIRMQQYNGTVEAHCRIEKTMIRAEEIRP